MNFYEKVVHYSELFLEEGTVFIKNNYMKFFVLVMLVVGVNMSQKAYTVIKNNKTFDMIVDDIQKEHDIDFEDVIQGSSYETKEGLMEFHRLVSKDDVYHVYILNNDYETPYILNENNDTWTDNQLDIPPLVSKAFIYYDIGIVESYEDGKAVLNDMEYVVEIDSGRVKIDDVGIYAPLPPQPNRTTKFIENYTSVPYGELEIIKSVLKEDKEIIYAQSGDEVYAIHLYFDDSVDIGIISKGKEKIKSGNSF